MWKTGVLVLLSGLLTACGGGSGADTSEVDGPNSIPLISGTPPTTAEVGQPYEFTPSASDADGDSLTFEIQNKPDWASFDPDTGTLEGTPPDSASTSYTDIVISVSDGTATSELPAFDLSVDNPDNAAPTISGTPGTSVIAGADYEFIPQISDDDGQTLVASITGKPDWAQFDTETGRLFGTPDAGDIGVHSDIVITVSDGIASASLPAFDIEVTDGDPGPANQPPSISGTPPDTVLAGDAYAFQATATDADGDALTFTIVNKPRWASFDRSTGELGGTPDAGDVRTYNNITIRVSDGSASDALGPFSITVESANGAPTIGGSPDTTATVDEAYSYTPTASDPDGDTLTFSVTNLPSWADFDTSTGEISGTPAAGDEGTYSGVRISVTDGSDSDQTAAFSIVVAAATTPGTVELVWTVPTKNDDGSNLADLAGYRIRYGTSASSLTEEVEIASPSITSATVEELSPGTWYFSIVSYNSGGTESEPTGTVSRAVD